MRMRERERGGGRERECVGGGGGVNAHVVCGGVCVHMLCGVGGGGGAPVAYDYELVPLHAALKTSNAGPGIRQKRLKLIGMSSL